MESPNVPQTIDFEEYKQETDTYRFMRTTCGLLGFVVFYLGTFCAFIVAGDTDRYYVLTVLLGAGMLIITTVIYCCVIHESSQLYEPKKPYQGAELVPLVSRSEQGSSINPQPEPQEELRWPSTDSGENTHSESDPELQELLKMGKSGKVSVTETGENPQAKDSTKSGGEFMDVELESTKAEPSKVADRSTKFMETDM